MKSRRAILVLLRDVFFLYSIAKLILQPCTRCFRSNCRLGTKTIECAAPLRLLHLLCPALLLLYAAAAERPFLASPQRAARAAHSLQYYSTRQFVFLWTDHDDQLNVVRSQLVTVPALWSVVLLLQWGITISFFLHDFFSRSFSRYPALIISLPDWMDN